MNLLFLKKNGGHKNIGMDNILNQIEEIRKRNNHLWMKILRLAFKYAPNESKVIMTNIVEYDEKIKDLCKELIDED